MKRASYKEAIAWVAMNDETADMNPESVKFFITSLLIADIFDVEEDKVGKDIVRFRKKNMDLTIQ